jgi:branched-chain amino acid transport system substrate-binding protein
MSPDVETLVSQVQTLMETNANITAENEALRKAASEIAGKTVRIGYIAPETKTYTKVKPFFEDVIEPDINEYAASLGNGVTFDFVLLDAQGQANRHLELTQQLHDEGVDIIIGAGWSSQGCAALSYLNIHKMLMISPSSTSPTTAIAGDRMFRMCPADTALAPALADILWDYGIKEVVFIQRGDSYGDGIEIQFTALFEEKGGTVNRVRYLAETTDFCPYLLEARTLGEEAIARAGGDESKVAVLLIAMDEATKILKQVSQCDILYNLTWFGADGTAKSSNITTNAPLEANHVKLYSLLAEESNSSKYTDVAARYSAATGENFTMTYGYIYDSAWVLAKSILETGSVDATRVTEVLPSVCENHYGVTGWCRLNEYGDRAPPPFDIWYYAPGASAPCASKLAGVYDPDNRTTAWGDV